MSSLRSRERTQANEAVEVFSKLEGEIREVKPGDAIAIPPGKKHKLWNTGNDLLRLLCCCAPAYEHEDTVITEA